jgi:hypothetical protein
MFEDSCFSGEVTDYGTPGSGHDRQKVVVADSKNRVLFISRVLQNRPSTGELLFENRKIFYLRSRTLENKNVSLYHWSEELNICWQWQNEREKISRWLETARPEDVIVLADFVAQESGLPETRHHPFLAILAKAEIEKRLRYLSLVQSQRLTSMMFPTMRHGPLPLFASCAVGGRSTCHISESRRQESL